MKPRYANREYLNRKNNKKKNRGRKSFKLPRIRRNIKLYFPRKVWISIITVLLIVFISQFIGDWLGSKGDDAYIKVMNAGKMLSFTELTEETIVDFLEKKEEDVITYEDTEKILDKLELSEVIKVNWDSVKKDKKITKEDWLEVYDEVTAFLDTEGKITYEKLYIIGDNSSIKELDKKEIYSEKGVYTADGLSTRPYLRQTVEVITRGTEILCIRNEIDAETTIANVWITETTDNGFRIFADGCYIDFKGETPKSKVENVIADIVVKGKEVTAIRTKEENINGKILSIQDNGIELEGYGLVPFSSGSRFYKVYGDLQEIAKEELSVGYAQTEFIVAEGQICAGLIVKPISAENIRVLVKSSDYKGNLHEQVTFTPSSDYTIAFGGNSENHAAGETITITADSSYWTDNRIKITLADLTAKTALDSVHRSCGTPSYRGFLEIVKTDGGLAIVNEVSLEEYLYSVLPSEMPSSYGLEALKAQAVCARSYAYTQLQQNAYPEYGAHVDDSTAFQVYQNYNEDELSIQAVNETAGEVMYSGGQIVNAYFFSTSSGHTTSDAVWGKTAEEASAYLKGTFVGKESSELDLTNEEQFASFIKSKDYDSYEAGEVWYRWSFRLSGQDMGAVINGNLKSVMENRSNCITVRNEAGEYVAGQISNLGDIQNIITNKRGTGGVVEELIIEGSAGAVKVTNENCIRQLLALGERKILRNDGTEAECGKLLPSAYFTVEMGSENDGIIFQFFGGGLGHGIGLSQNGAKAMAEQGMNYIEILQFFYSDVVIQP